jgi:DNA repair protein RadC
MGLATIDPRGNVILLPRERGFSEGFETLGDDELLAVLLGTGEKGRSVVRVAADLLERVGGIRGLCDLGPHALAAERGIGEAKAARIAASLELGRRVIARSVHSVRIVVGSSQEVAAWARPRLVHLDHEQVWVLVLDGRNGLKAARRVAEGGLHGCSLRPSDVLRVVVRNAGSAFVLVHNHPSGDAKPSDQDVELTEALVRAGVAIGTPLVDHVIVAGASHTSLFDLGVVRPKGAG